MPTMHRPAETHPAETHPGETVTGPHAFYPRCPLCSSYEVTRRTEAGRVWFTCRRCGFIFT